MLETRLLLGLFNSHGLGSLVQFSLGLQSHDSSTPLAHQLGVLVELLQSQFLEDLELGNILLVHSGEGNDSRCLLVDKGSKTCLILYNEERDLHLTAEGRKPEDELDGVDITGDEDEGCLLLLNEGGYVLQSELELMGDIGSLSLSLDLGSSLLLLTLLLCGRRLGTVLVQQLENVDSLVLANCLGKLVDGRGDLKTLVQHGALTLDAHVFGPSDKTAEISSSGADGTTDVEGTRTGGEKRVGLGGGLLDRGALRLGGFLGCHGECWVEKAALNC